MMIKCTQCGATEIVKNGKVFAKQRYKCKKCGFQFTKPAPAGKPLFLKLVTHSLYLSGLSMRECASVVGVTAQSVSRWIKKWHPAYMAEVGNKTNIHTMTGQEIDEYLHIDSKDVLLVSTMILPSGARFNTIIQLPKSLVEISVRQKNKMNRVLLQKSLKK